MPPHPDAASVQDFAYRSLETLAANADATPGDLRQLGTKVWFALTGENFIPPLSGEPFPWEKLGEAGITPELGALPVLLARTLAAVPHHSLPSATAVLQTLNMLASLRPTVPVWQDMPSRAPGPDPAPPLEARPPVPPNSELWTRGPAQLAISNRRRRGGADVLNTLILLVAGALGGFLGGVLYEKTHGPGAAAANPGITAAPSPQAVATPPPVPEVALPPSPPVSATAITARVRIIKTRQPDVGDILKYAREFRRVGTLPVMTTGSFPSEDQFARLVERFDWTQPDSPNFHRTPLLVVLGYANEEAVSQKNADQLAQVLTQSGVTSPVYTCGMGSGQATPEVEKAGVGTDGKFVEVWVAFTLF